MVLLTQNLAGSPRTTSRRRGQRGPPPVIADAPGYPVPGVGPDRTRTNLLAPSPSNYLSGPGRLAPWRLIG